MKTILLGFVFLLIAALAIYAYMYAINSPYRISSDIARQLLKDDKIDMVIDARTGLERVTLGSYPGSVHIQTSEIDSIMPYEYPDRNLRILVYCNSGQRSRTATEKLIKLGYKNTRYIATPYQTLL